MSILFIADLHLEDSRPDLNRAFSWFCQNHAEKASALYILGDLFNAWVGDDDGSATSQLVAKELKSLHKKGIAVYLQHGNRDFLMGEEFASRCCAKLLPDTLTISPYGKPILLMHGDQLCLDDIDYQHFRTMVRSTTWQQEFLTKPLTERQQIAADLRKKSREASRVKANDIMDVTPSAVLDTMSNFGVDLLIHGHTHRPAVHQETTDKTRIVLGDWDSMLWYLQLDSNNKFQSYQQPVKKL